MNNQKALFGALALTLGMTFLTPGNASAATDNIILATSADFDRTLTAYNIQTRTMEVTQQGRHPFRMVVHVDDGGVSPDEVGEIWRQVGLRLDTIDTDYASHPDDTGITTERTVIFQLELCMRHTAIEQSNCGTYDINIVVPGGTKISDDLSEGTESFNDDFSDFNEAIYDAINDGSTPNPPGPNPNPPNPPGTGAGTPPPPHGGGPDCIGHSHALQ